MLIKNASYNINTGFSGADYNYYIESIDGKWMNIFINYPQQAVKYF
jgi:hypothetical protein